VYEKEQLEILYGEGEIMAVHALTDYSKISDKAFETNLRIHGNHSSIRQSGFRAEKTSISV